MTSPRGGRVGRHLDGVTCFWVRSSCRSGLVLQDILNGTRRYAVTARETEEAWRALAPVLNGWKDGDEPLETYPAGSDGP